MPPLSHLARRMNRVKPNAVGDLLRAGSDPSLISFAGGYPDGSLFPTAELDQLFHAAITSHGARTLQYTIAEGDPQLRAGVAARYAAQGFSCSADDVLIVQGSQQGIDLAAKLMIDPGDVIVTENPTFVGAIVAYDPYEPRYEPIAADKDGLDTEQLEAALRKGLRPKLVYTIPDFQNPTGATLSTERRKHLVALAAQYEFVILEDTAYRPLRYAGEAPPSLLSLDREGRVIHLGSFSKVLTPGMRLGWVISSRPLIEKLGLLKLAADTQTSTLNMAVAAGFLATYDLDAHVEKLRAAYTKKRDLMLSAMRRHFPQEVSSTEPDGGLFVWLTFPKSFDTAAFMAQHALPDAKVAYVPGATFFPVQQPGNFARFNFSGPSEEKIEEGMARLGVALKSAMRNAR